jgi:hypothetical protein
MLRTFFLKFLRPIIILIPIAEYETTSFTNSAVLTTASDAPAVKTKAVILAADVRIAKLVSV